MLGSKIIEQYKKLPTNSFVLSSDKSTGKEGGDKFGKRFLIHEVGEDYLSIVDIRNSEVRDLPNSEQVNQYVKDHPEIEIAIKITAQALEDEAKYMAVPEYEAVSSDELDKLNSAIQNSDPSQAREETVSRIVIRATLDTGLVKDRYRKSSKPKQQNEGSGSDAEQKSNQEQSQPESSKSDSSQSSTSSDKKPDTASSEKSKSTNSSSLFSDSKSNKSETGDKSGKSVSSPFSAN